MKFIQAGLAAVVVFFTCYLLLALLEDPISDLMNWPELGLAWGGTWWRASAGLTIAACVFRLVIARRNNAALEWRKTLAARARA